MNDYIAEFLVFVTGFALGILFFLGLWLTVKKALVSKRPSLWFIGSLVLRIGITMLGFYYVAMGNWINMLICLFGFITARFIVLSVTRIKDRETVEITK